MKLKILSYNIHKGYDWKTKNYFLHDMKELINSAHADLVLLQEVTGQNNSYKKNGLIDVQFEFLADSIWPHYQYAKNVTYDDGHHGNLILSRYPILNSENVNLTTNYFEKRGFLICELQIPEQNRNIYAGCLHLNLLHKSRIKQYQIVKNKILSLSLSATTPLIVGGDFNDWNQKASHVLENDLGMLEAFKAIHGRYAQTFPATYPMLSLDRIYVKNANIISSSIVRSSKEYHFSDHLPLCCEVEIGG